MTEYNLPMSLDETKKTLLMEGITYVPLKVNGFRMGEFYGNLQTSPAATLIENKLYFSRYNNKKIINEQKVIKKALRL